MLDLSRLHHLESLVPRNHLTIRTAGCSGVATVAVVSERLDVRTTKEIGTEVPIG